ncbi:hypothetical protein Ctob_011333, partial [Chrysochromulina tobinii]
GADAAKGDAVDLVVRADDRAAVPHAHVLQGARRLGGRGAAVRVAGDALDRRGGRHVGRRVAEQDEAAPLAALAQHDHTLAGHRVVRQAECLAPQSRFRQDRRHCDRVHRCARGKDSAAFEYDDRRSRLGRSARGGEGVDARTSINDQPLAGWHEELGHEQIRRFPDQAPAGRKDAANRFNLVADVCEGGRR